MRLKRDTQREKTAMAITNDLQAIFREYMRLERKRSSEGLSVEELQVWTVHKQTLNRRFQPDADERYVDRRQSLRVPVHLEVSFQTSGELHERLMTNLSRGGVYIATASPLEIGTKVSLRLCVRDIGEPIEVMTEVVSRNVGGKGPTAESGMGLRFIDLGEKEEAFLEELYGHCALRAVEALEAD